MNPALVAGERRVVSIGVRWIIVGLLIIGVCVGGCIYAGRAISPWMSARIIRALQENFDSRLEIQSLSVSLFPSAQIVGRGVVLRRKGETDLPPLASIEKLTAEASTLALLRTPMRVRRVRLEGLQIHVIARSESGSQSHPAKTPAFVLEEVIADGTRLETIPMHEGKEPLVWDIARLALHDIGPGQPMTFRAVLTNAKPPGEIHTTGTFGPWERAEPRLTPVSGNYLFRDANLAVFPGILGTLSSTGHYKGVLDRIEVEGETDTPDFALSVSGNRMRLTTNYQAVVDGRDGTTRLQPVVAHFWRSTVVARGIVESHKGAAGKTIRLDVRVQDGGLADLLRLGVKGKPPMHGVTSIHTKFLLPPGERDISQRLQLDGGFNIASARFLNPDTQQRINALSHRGSGHPKDIDPDPVASNFQGQFTLHNGVMDFSSLSFAVPGVGISLKGAYGLGDESLDFHGKARLDAKLSRTTTGFKAFLLKPVDPFFKKDGAGAVLPIKIVGTREAPVFGLEFRRKEK